MLPQEERLLKSEHDTFEREVEILELVGETGTVLIGLDDVDDNVNGNNVDDGKKDDMMQVNEDEERKTVTVVSRKGPQTLNKFGVYAHP